MTSVGTHMSFVGAGMTSVEADIIRTDTDLAKLKLTFEGVVRLKK